MMRAKLLAWAKKAYPDHWDKVDIESQTDSQQSVTWNKNHLKELYAAFGSAEAQSKAEELLQRAKNTVEDFSAELEKRRTFTYQMNIHAKESIALTSYQRAISFRTIVTEYIETLKHR